MEYVPYAEDLEALGGAQDTEWASNQILIGEILSYAGEEVSSMYYQRDAGYLWPEIAKELGISVTRAKDRFRYGIEKARKRILGEKNSKSKLSPALARKI